MSAPASSLWAAARDHALTTALLLAAPLAATPLTAAPPAAPALPALPGPCWLLAVLGKQSKPLSLWPALLRGAGIPALELDGAPAAPPAQHSAAQQQHHAALLTALTAAPPASACFPLLSLIAHAPPLHPTLFADRAAPTLPALPELYSTSALPSLSALLAALASPAWLLPLVHPQPPITASSVTGDRTTLVLALGPAPAEPSLPAGAPLALRSAWGSLPLCRLMTHAHALLPPAAALLRLSLLLRAPPPSRATALRPALALLLPLAELLHGSVSEDDDWDELLAHPLLVQLAATPLAEACHADALVEAAQSSVSTQHRLLRELGHAQDGEDEASLETAYWRAYARSTAPPAWPDAALHLHVALTALTVLARARTHAEMPAPTQDKTDAATRVCAAALLLPAPPIDAALAASVLRRATAVLNHAAAAAPGEPRASASSDLRAVAVLGQRAVKAAACALAVDLTMHR